VVAVIAGERIVAVAAVEQVRAVAAAERVVAAEAEDGVVAAVARERIRAAGAEPRGGGLDLAAVPGRAVGEGELLDAELGRDEVVGDGRGLAARQDADLQV